MLSQYDEGQTFFVDLEKYSFFVSVCFCVVLTRVCVALTVCAGKCVLHSQKCSGKFGAEHSLPGAQGTSSFGMCIIKLVLKRTDLSIAHI